MCYCWDYPEATEIVKFDRQGEKGPWGAADDGIIVFVDRNMGIEVSQGETWVCRLCRNPNPESKNYWAWPIDRIEKKEETSADLEKNMPVQGDDTITVIGTDAISSRMFEGRYIAYRSLDGAYLELIKDPKGDIIARNGELRIKGLGEFIDPKSTSLGYKHGDGIFLIRLDQRLNGSRTKGMII